MKPKKFFKIILVSMFLCLSGCERQTKAEKLEKLLVSLANNPEFSQLFNLDISKITITEDPLVEKGQIKAIVKEERDQKGVLRRVLKLKASKVQTERLRKILKLPKN